MTGAWATVQEELFHEFRLELHVPARHLLSAIDRFVDLSGIRRHLAPYYSAIGRPSIDPEVLIRMLIVGYRFGIRPERRLCEEVHLYLAYRGFCRLGREGDVPDRSAFWKLWHDLIRDAALLRDLFETVAAAWRGASSAGNALRWAPALPWRMPSASQTSRRASISIPSALNSGGVSRHGQ